jgi:hypothetical protein
VKLRLYGSFFTKLKANYVERGGAAASHEIQLAKVRARGRERELAVEQADSWVAEAEARRVTLAVHEAEETRRQEQLKQAMITQSSAVTARRRSRYVDGGSVLPKQQQHTHHLSSSSGGGGGGGSGRGRRSGDTQHMHRKALAPVPPPPSAKTTAVESSVKMPGFWDMLGADFFKNSGQWVGFTKPSLAGRVGDTLFIRVNTKSEHSVQCGRSPLYLTHDDEDWAPVVLQGKHDDGSIDYEKKYVTDTSTAGTDTSTASQGQGGGEGTGASWFLSQEPFIPTYDPMRKCEIWMPAVFTEDQLRLWRGCFWDRICAQEGIRKRNETQSQFHPGSYVEVKVEYPEEQLWQGMVYAVNADGSFFVANGTTTGCSIPGAMLRKMGGGEVTAELVRDVQAGLQLARRGSVDNTDQRPASTMIPGYPPAAGDGVDGDHNSQHRRKGTYMPLHYAAAECGVGVLQNMMDDEDDRVEVNKQDGCGCTPLHWAASVGRLQNVNLLLEYGADDTMTNYMGLTPLEWAQHRNKSRIADQLREMDEKSSGKFMDRDNGACADKINVVMLLQTIEFLKQRARRPKMRAVDMVRMRRQMKHALRAGTPLISFAQNLLQYNIHDLLPKKQNSSTDGTGTGTGTGTDQNQNDKSPFNSPRGPMWCEGPFCN